MIVLSSVTYSAAPLDCAVSGIATDSADDIIVSGCAAADAYLTVRYSRNLASPKIKSFAAAGTPHAVLTTSLDNIVVAGDVTLAGDSVASCLVLKYDTLFQDVVASATYSAAGDVRVMAAARDARDTIYVTGSAHNASYDYCTLKYDRDLHLLAQQTYDNENGTNDRAYGIAVDRDGNVIVTGEQDSADHSRKYFYTVKYDAALQPLYTARYEGGMSAAAAAVTVDGDNNIIVTGKQSDGTRWSYCTVKYDPSLNQLAVAVSDSGKDEIPAAVAVDADGTIVVTGKQSDGIMDNYYTVKYDRDLQPLAAHSYDGGNTDQAAGIVVDSQDNVIVTGKSFDGTANSIFTLKYNASPRITGVTNACQGATGEVTITGRGFADGSTVAFATPGITVDAVAVIPQSQIRATVTVSSAVPIGISTVTVTNVNGETASCADRFSVTYQKAIVIAADDTASVLLADGSLRLAVPAWTFLTAAAVTVTGVPAGLPNTGTLRPTGLAATLAVTPAQQLQKDVVLTFSYGDALAGTVNESRLAIAYYDDTAARWVALPSILDPDANRVTGSTRDISRRFALVEMPASAADLSKVRVYPNPYKPGSGGDFDNPVNGEGIVFSNLVPEFTLKIFTIAGDLVVSKTATADAFNTYLWDTRSDGGQEAASGVYLYVIENAADTAQRAKGKFAIIR
jgi:hypothetical protein